MARVLEAASTTSWSRHLAVAVADGPAVAHNAWDSAYAKGELFEWFSRFRRNPNPDRVRLTTRDLRYASAFWARIDSLVEQLYA